MIEKLEVEKVKGLIMGARNELLDIHCNLAIDNLRDVSEKLDSVYEYFKEIDKICANVKNYEEEEETKNGGDEWI